MHTIEFDSRVMIADTEIAEIKVADINLKQLVEVWGSISPAAKSAEIALRRARIRLQAHFLDKDGKRQLPTDPDITQLPAGVARGILANLDKNQGVMGELVLKGDGAAKPIVYKLGTPIKMQGGSGEITELEFMASTYGELEDILAADTELARTYALLEHIANPVGLPMPRLPGWALDRITVADGVGILNHVTPHF